MIPYSQMCNVCNACNARIAAVYFLRKVSIFSGKVAKRNSAKYKPPGNLIEDRRQRGQSNGDSIGSYPVLPTNNTRIAANCCDITTLTSTVGKLLHAAYLECELRRIVCWLLIVSAEI